VLMRCHKDIALRCHRALRIPGIVLVSFEMQARERLELPHKTAVCSHEVPGSIGLLWIEGLKIWGQAISHRTCTGTTENRGKNGKRVAPDPAPAQS